MWGSCPRDWPQVAPPIVQLTSVWFEIALVSTALYSSEAAMCRTTRYRTIHDASLHVYHFTALQCTTGHCSELSVVLCSMHYRRSSTQCNAEPYNTLQYGKGRRYRTDRTLALLKKIQKAALQRCCNMPLRTVVQDVTIS